jgi:hypothetical protein
MGLLFQAVRDKNCSHVEKYIGDNIKWHDGCYGENGSDILLNWSKQDFMNVLLNNGCFGFEKEKTINFQIAEGDKVFSHLTYEGVFDKGKIYVYPPNGKKVRFNALYTTKFENGLIVEMWVTLEGATILHQIGAVKLI